MVDLSGADPTPPPSFDTPKYAMSVGYGVRGTVHFTVSYQPNHWLS